MGNFFTSPKEQAATSMYDQAMKGQTPWDALMSQRSTMAKNSLEQQGNRLMASTGADTMSQLASAGITPGSSAAVDTVNRQKAGIGGQVMQGEAQIDIGSIADQINSLMQLMQTGYGGLSASSSMGDILAGMQTLGNVGMGAGMMGGSQGFGLWGGSGQSGDVQGWADFKKRMGG
jgi:hypothetical protein